MSFKQWIGTSLVFSLCGSGVAYGMFYLGGKAGMALIGVCVYVAFMLGVRMHEIYKWVEEDRQAGRIDARFSDYRI